MSEAQEPAVDETTGTGQPPDEEPLHAVAEEAPVTDEPAVVAEDDESAELPADDELPRIPDEDEDGPAADWTDDAAYPVEEAAEEPSFVPLSFEEERLAAQEEAAEAPAPEEAAPLPFEEEIRAAAERPTMSFEAAAMAEEPPVAGFEPRVPSMDTPRMSPLLALVRVLVLPRSTFERVAEENVTAWPAAVALLGLAAVTKVGVGVGFALRGTPPFAPLAAVGVRYGWALVAPFAFMFAFAGALLLAQRIWGGEASFRGILNVTSLALVPLAIGSFAQAFYMALRHRVLVHPGLSALAAPPGTGAGSRTLYALLGQIDAFTLWAFVLLVVGAAVCRRRGWMRPTIAAIAITLALALVSIVPNFVVAVLLG